MTKSATLTSVVTPRGSLEWVTITGEGVENLSGKMQYKANIVFDPKEAAWKQLMDEVDAFWVKYRPKKIKDPKSTGFYEHMRKTDETDEDGVAIKEPTGLMVLSFKTSTTWPDGSPNVVKTYNSKGRPAALGDTKIGNGTVGAIAGAYDIYLTKSKQGAVVDAGVTFYLNGIKISKLVEYSEDCAFEADEDAEDGWTGEAEWDEEEKPTAGPRL